MNSSVVYNTAIPDHFAYPINMQGGSTPQGTALELLSDLVVCVIGDKSRVEALEHCTFVVEFDEWRKEWAEFLLNRPGIHFRYVAGKARITCSLLTALYWNANSGTQSRVNLIIGAELATHAASLAPQIVAAPKTNVGASHLVSPECTDEVWVSVWLRGSRAFAYRMLQHRDVVISSIDSRFFDESETLMCWHPSLRQRLIKNGDMPCVWGKKHLPNDSATTITGACRVEYDAIYDSINESACADGIDSSKSRIQARGAALQVLPMALETHLIMSASLKQWNQILSKLCSPFEDAETREIMTQTKRNIFGERIKANDEDEN